MAQARTARPARRGTNARRRQALRAPVWLTVLTTALLVAGVAAVVVANALSPAQAPPPPSTTSVARLTAYQAAITPTLQAAGAMVEQEIKPSIASLQNGTLTPAQMRSRAGAWRTRFEQARAAVARVSVPPGLTAAAADFDRALQGYEASLAPLAALPDGATTGPIASAIQAAADAARRADGLYDQAAAMIQAQRRALGLAATIDLPDPTPAP